MKASRARARVRLAPVVDVVLASVLSVVLVGAATATGFVAAGRSPVVAAPRTTPPNLTLVLGGYSAYWTASGRGDLHGTVDDAAVLRRDDELAVWINRHATPAERFLALQDSEYDGGDGGAYDPSMTVSTGLGSALGAAYVAGRNSGALPLTSALLNSSTGSSGAFVTTGTPKQFFGHPRPYLPSDPSRPAVAGDVIGCSPSVANGSSQRSIRVGQPYADAEGNLLIERVPAAIDRTHQFSPNDVLLDAGYGTTGICAGGSFPSGHTTSAYQAGITLATLLPELAPEILARASEAGNDRIVLGVHYPLDVMGGRLAGEAAMAARWSDVAYRTAVLEPARAELLAYLRTATGHDLAWNMAHQTPYRSDPYGGSPMPGGTAQVVTDRASAVAVYTERMTYGFPASGVSSASGAIGVSGVSGVSSSPGASGAPGTSPGPRASVPAGASNLLLTAFPTLTDAQRTAVLAQTELPSGFPLDGTGTAAGAWQRLNLAAALSARVRITDGVAHVIAIGVAPSVVGAAAP